MAARGAFLIGLVLAVPCQGADRDAPKDFPAAEAIGKAWTSRVPGRGESMRFVAAKEVDLESPEGRAVRARFGWLQRRRIAGVWRAGEGVGISTKDIREPDFKGQNNSSSSFPVCYVARVGDGYWLVDLVERWSWGKPPSFGVGKVRVKLE